MEGVMGAGDKQGERLDDGLQRQLNLDSVKTRAISLFRAITRIIDDLTTISRNNSLPKWQEVLGNFSMVNLELFNIVEDVKKVSKSFVVLPKSVNADNSTVLPVMLSSKLLPEMEMDDNAKKDLLLLSMQNLPISQQIANLESRVVMIEKACESAEKVIADTRKAYFGSRQGLNTVPTLDKVQAAKIQQQETLLRNAVNHGEGLRIQGDQRQNNSALPLHLVDVLSVGDSGQLFPDPSGMYMKNNTPPLSSNNNNSQGNLLQATTTGSQLTGRAAGASSSGGGGMPSFDNTAASPMQYANSPRSGTTNMMMNTPSPQQQNQQQQQQQQQQQHHQQQQHLQQHQQQRQKAMQLPPHQQQLLAQQQQLRQASMSGLGQMHGQHQIQYSSAMGTQQFQGRQMPPGAIQQGMSQGQLNQGNQLNRHPNQFANTANSALFNAAQNSANPQMISNMSANMSSQSGMPRMQFGLSGGTRTHGSQILGDQMFNMGASNPGNMIPVQHQQQQHGSQGSLGNMPQNSQNMQSNMATLQQNHPNFQQQNQP